MDNALQRLGFLSLQLVHNNCYPPPIKRHLEKKIALCRCQYISAHPIDLRDLKKYYYLCHQSATFITHFKIELHQRYPTDSITTSIGTLSIEDILRNLKNLTHLEIFGIHGRFGTNKVFNDSTYVTCSQLTSLNLKYYHFKGLTHLQKEITSITDDSNTRSFLKFISFDNNNENNNNSKPIYNNLKEITLLDLNIEGPKQLYNFIKLHKHLTVLNLQVNALISGAWQQEKNLGTIDSNLGIQQLLNHLNSIPFLNLNIEDIKIQKQRKLKVVEFISCKKYLKDFIK
jgi:hypothetical protein